MDIADKKEKEIAWHLHRLPPQTKRAFLYLAKQKWLRTDDWYLAGGTALALHAGHRASVDLDFFTQKKDFSITALVNHFPENIWKTEIIKEGTLYGILYGAKISFISYPFFIPALQFQQYENINILQKDDIAIMKIIAISQRGKKRDFVDLYWYCKNVKTLTDILPKLQKQYPNVAHDYHHILKSLCYFDDAESDPMPKLFFKTRWNEVKKYFQKEVEKTTKKILELSE